MGPEGLYVEGEGGVHQGDVLDRVLDIPVPGVTRLLNAGVYKISCSLSPLPKVRENIKVKKKIFMRVLL